MNTTIAPCKMKLLSASIGCAFYLVVIYSINTYLSDSVDTLDKKEFHYKKGAEYSVGFKRSHGHAGHKKSVNFEKFYKVAVDRLIPKLSREEQRELTKWSNEKQIIQRAKKCDDYFNTFTPITFDETIKNYEKKSLEKFNLAFVHNIQKDVAIYEAFLSIYFRPNNIYCIHLDRKADDEIREALELLVKCYSQKVENGKIFLLDHGQSYEINWGGDLLVKADNQCLHQLLVLNRKQKVNWRYVSIMSGDELPLLPYSQYHQEIARKLKRDKSAVESVPTPNMQVLNRATTSQRKACSNCPEEIKTKPFNSSWKSLVSKAPLQFSISSEAKSSKAVHIQIFKGIRNVILCAKDADFIAHHEISKTFMNWQMGGQFTDEHFYSTLIRFRKDKIITNSFAQDKSRKPEYYLNSVCPRYTHWYFGPRMGTKSSKKKACFGKFTYGVCTFNIFDLSSFENPSNTCLTATRFSLDIDSTAVLIHLINLMSKSFLETNTATQKIREYQEGPEQRFVNRFFENMNRFLLD